MKRLFIAIVISTLLSSAGFSQCKPAKIMTWRQYSRLRPKWPYLIRINSTKAQLIYYGVSHTYDPKDPQLAEIEKLWTKFHPDIAFNEGGNPPIEKSRDEAVKKFGEPGLIRFLANRDQVTSIDPSRAEIMAFLRKSFSSEQIKLYFVLQVVAQTIKNHPNESLDEEVRRVFTIFSDTPGLNVTPASIAELETSYKHFFQNGDYKEASLSWFDPVKSENFLNDISRQLNIYRDQYMVGLVAQHALERQKVFAVAGGSQALGSNQATPDRSFSSGDFLSLKW